jgi:SAM-dependent methyltransferase
MGVDGFSFDCFDLSSFVLDRARAAVDRAGLSTVINLHEVDLNAWEPSVGSYQGIMANHSLHHLVDLERVFASVKSALIPGGVFVNADMIGRNGHMRWPEALEIIESIWRFAPARYKYNHLLRREERDFVNWDCSVESFEGVRAQDILPLLVESFAFERFVAFGNLPDVFVDRTFGPNLSPDAPEDCAFIDFLELLNVRLIDAGVIKPTQMFAVMTNGRAEDTSTDRGWTPRFAIRAPSTD